MTKVLIPQESIANKIYLIRGRKIMLDRDLAQLYRVKPIRLREQVKRNIKRFPDDFMFRLTPEEANILVSQNAIPSKRSLGGYLPYVFTEQGVAMLSSVLKNERAITVNIQIMRTFVRIKEMLITHKDLQQKIEEMERKYDQQFRIIFDAIKQLIIKEHKPKKTIGFHNK
jgi:hypothetical protein